MNWIKTTNRRLAIIDKIIKEQSPYRREKRGIKFLALNMVIFTQPKPRLILK